MYNFDLRYSPYKTGIKKAPIFMIGAFFMPVLQAL